MRFSLLLFSLFILSTTSVDELNSARAYFQSGRDNKASAEKLQKLTQGKESAILKAYNGGSLAILAKHQTNPLKKLDYLKKGLAIINNAVLLDAAEIEIRFVRFAVEENIPGFISFTSHVESDKKMLLNNLNPTHSNYTMIKSYLLNSTKISETEKKKIK
jgi:hypothetical protein